MSCLVRWWTEAPNRMVRLKENNQSIQCLICVIFHILINFLPFTRLSILFLILKLILCLRMPTASQSPLVPYIAWSRLSVHLRILSLDFLHLHLSLRLPSLSTCWCISTWFGLHKHTYKLWFRNDCITVYFENRYFSFISLTSLIHILRNVLFSFSVFNLFFRLHVSCRCLYLFIYLYLGSYVISLL